MSEKLRKLREDFLEAAHAGGPPAIYDATVLDVDNEAYTCTIDLDGIELPNIRLRAIVSNSHSVDVLPSVGSAVLVAKLDVDDFIIIASDVITDWRVTVGTTSVAIDTGGVEISKGDETLKNILTDLIAAVLTIAAAKDAAALKQLLTRVNNLLK
ncbi:hypothetical protein [Mucilaginibacter rubeus]|uniref:Uncharacterized protein n=1 Tax=Mucilaginibacter rubeus TaxID=2027860 RepID=A0A5C1I6A4_9SPHI|nr:hypothetical protein [Mucilaginibacter rubeus]QEM13485.1 hypothetical protein DEO27_026895 [Mucilaginibacter rubeus]